MHLRQALAGALKPVLGWVRERPIRAGLVGLLAVLFAFFLAVMAYGEPAWAYWLFGAGEKFRVLEFVGIAMGGVLLAIGAEIANRRAVALEDAAKAQAGAARAQAEANKGAEDGRRQERLKNAIGHLGHDSDSVRMGGAYELFHLAKDTEDLRQTVLDILCAHIRRTTGEGKYREKYKSKPSEEVQSLLTLLFVQEHTVFEGCRANLQRSWLNGATLTGSRLQRAVISRTHLQEADLLSGQLQGADLSRTWLQSAKLLRVRLLGAELIGARLQEAELSMAQLQGVDLTGTDMRGAQLFATQLQGANLSAAKLQGVTCQILDDSSFAARIRAGVGRENDLSGATFAGGLSRECVDSSVKGMPGEEAGVLLHRLQPHIDKPASHEPPNSSVTTRAYTAEEAERWIAEYEEAMRGVPEGERA